MENILKNGVSIQGMTFRYTDNGLMLTMANGVQKLLNASEAWELLEYLSDFQGELYKQKLDVDRNMPRWATPPERRVIEAEKHHDEIGENENE